jgi:hypothetical protein
LPGAEPKQALPTVNFNLEFTAVGTPAVVKQNSATSRAPVSDPAGLAADECWQDLESYVCRRKGVLFELSWTGNPTPVDRYEDQDPHVSTSAYWHDQVAVEFVKIVTGKLP